MYARPAIGQLPMAARGLGTVDLAPRALTRAQEKADCLRRIQQIFSSTGVLGGVWTCDPDYVRQDSTGTTAAAVGAPMGFVYDQSRRMALGPNLIVNGTFDTDLSGWTATGGWVWDAGQARCPESASGDLSFIGTTKNKWYIAGYTISDAIRSGIYITVGEIDIGYFGNGTHKVNAAAYGTRAFRARTFASTGGCIDNISVCEVLGAHANQPTTANKPTLKLWPGTDIRWCMTETDTTALTVTFPSSLGSSCYRARAGVNGVREYFNQTIGTTLNLVDGPFFAEVVLNRAPTDYERRVILAWLRFYVPMAQPSLAAVQAIYAAAVGGVWLTIAGNLYATNDTSTPASVGGKIGYVADVSGLGKNAVQATDANRPILRQAPESRVLFSDVSPSSPALTATFASPVGAECRVFEVTPTGVKKRVASVSTSFNLLTRYKYWGGTVLVNRATTDVEDAAILALMDQFVPTSSAPMSTAFAINQTGGGAVNLTIATVDSMPVTIVWGDGTTTDVASGVAATKTYSGDYVGAVTVVSLSPIDKFSSTSGKWSFGLSSLPAGLTFFQCSSSNNITGSLSSLPAGLTYFYCQAANTISGNLSSLPSGLTYFTCGGSNTISGNLSSLPSGLTYFYCAGYNTIGGDSLSLPSGTTDFTCHGYNTIGGNLSSLPSGLKNFVCVGSNTITGSLSSLPSGMTYFSCYGSNTISGSLSSLPSGLTYFSCTGVNTVSGNLSSLPSGLTYFYCYGSNTVSGNLSSLPSGLTTFVCHGSSAISGNLSSLPSGLTYFSCGGYNVINGSLSSLPSGITFFYCYGSNTIDGNLSSLPSGIIYFHCYGANTVNGYDGKSWASNQQRIALVPVAPGGLSSAKVDQLLIDLAAAGGTWGGDKAVYLKGTNAARTSASDSAVATLQSKGVTVTTN